uniref:Uncharacterized protein n=1 Tax=Anguilla anguilla TaxID=7936 RepID=A0A0E9XBU5_ANGAN
MSCLESGCSREYDEQLVKMLYCRSSVLEETEE